MSSVQLAVKTQLVSGTQAESCSENIPSTDNIVEQVQNTDYANSD
jgi:hypothetical protein